MAKRVSKKATMNTDENAFVIPEEYAPNMRLFSDELGTEYIEIKFAVRRFWQVQLLKGVKMIGVDVAMFAGLIAFSKLFDYGLGRFLRDGAKASEEIKKEDGTKYTRKFSLEEKIADAEANAAKKLASLYGTRAMGSRQSGVSILVKEMQLGAMQFCIDNMQDVDGKAYKRNTVPSAIAKGDSVESIALALKSIGVPDEYTKVITESAETIADLREGAKTLKLHI